MPLLIVGATLLGTYVGTEITFAAVVDTGGDALAVREATETLTLPLFLAGVLLFGLGWLGFAMAFYSGADSGECIELVGHRGPGTHPVRVLHPPNMGQPTHMDSRSSW